MKRFTVMLDENTIYQIKKAKYSPSKKRIIIESILLDIFYKLESIDYPEKIYLSSEVKNYEK